MLIGIYLAGSEKKTNSQIGDDGMFSQGIRLSFFREFNLCTCVYLLIGSADVFAQGHPLPQQINTDEIDSGRAYYADNEFLVLEGANIAVSLPSTAEDGKFQQADVRATLHVDPLNEYAFVPNGAQYRGLLFHDGTTHIMVCLVTQQAINRVVVLKNGVPIPTDAEGNLIEWNRKLVNPAESYGFQVEVTKSQLTVYSIKDEQEPILLGEFNVSLKDFTISLMLQSISAIAPPTPIQMVADRIEIHSPQLQHDSRIEDWKTISQ